MNREDFERINKLLCGKLNSKELKDFNDWLHHGGPSKKQIEEQKILNIRKEIAEECLISIRNELDIFQGPTNEGDYGAWWKKADCLTNIIKIIRGEK